jgi:DNA-binding CsgD family transcriptional regulator
MSDGGAGTQRSVEPSSVEPLLERLKLPRELSAREVAVLAAAARGLDTKATAAQLGLSAKTVDEYWRRVYRKLGCRSRIEVLSRLFSVAVGEAETVAVSAALNDAGSGASCCRVRQHDEPRVAYYSR